MLMALSVMVAFVLAPLSSASDIEHVCDSGSLACSSVSFDDFSPEDTPDHEGHDHSAHHCGSCHIHLIGGLDTADSVYPYISRLGVTPLHERRAGSGPGGLYRPPRV